MKGGTAVSDVVNGTVIGTYIIVIGALNHTFSNCNQIGIENIFGDHSIKTN